jgi:hypothetical protein
MSSKKPSSKRRIFSGMMGAKMRAGEKIARKTKMDVDKPGNL